MPTSAQSFEMRMLSGNLADCPSYAQTLNALHLQANSVQPRIAVRVPNGMSVVDAVRSTLNALPTLGTEESLDVDQRKFTASTLAYTPRVVIEGLAVGRWLQVDLMNKLGVSHKKYVGRPGY